MRELNHITQKNLGDLLGISDRAVSKWESGLSKPSGENLISYKKNVEQERVKVFSIGGGSIAFENDDIRMPEKIYKLDRFSSIAKYCEEKNIRLWQYAI